MAYEQSKFGDGSATGSGNVTTAVNNHYGPRDVGKTVGIINTEGVMNELVIDLDGDMVSAEAFPLLAPKLPAGSRIEDVFVHVTEAFVLGGTSPIIEVGTEGSEATNGFSITEAQAEALGIYDLTSALSGTWAAATGLAAETTLGIDLAGTNPTVTSAGKARIVIRYVRAV
jgi:hypothetical protein